MKRDPRVCRGAGGSLGNGGDEETENRADA